MKKSKYLLLAGTLIITYLNETYGQNATQNKLTVSTIMQEPSRFSGYSPQDLHWEEDGKTLYFKWNPESLPIPALYRYNLHSSKPVVIAADNHTYIVPDEKVYIDNYSSVLFVNENTLYLKNTDNYITRKLLSLDQKISNLVAGKDGDKVYFTIDDDLHVLYLQSGFTQQLTKIRKKASDDNNKGDQDSWLEDQQREMFTVFKEEDVKKAFNDSIADLKARGRPLEIEIGEASLSSVKSSSTGKFAVAMLSHSNDDGMETEVPHFVTRSGFTEEKKARKKVGAPYARTSMLILDFENDTTWTVFFDDFPGILDTPEYFSIYGRKGDGVPKQTTVTEIAWAPNGKGFLGNLRSQDNKDRWIFYYHVENKEVSMLNWQHDSAWVAGPGIGYTWGGAEFGWLDEGNEAWFLSEETGYAHLYRQETGEDDAVQVTRGNFEIYNPVLSRDKEYWYFTANRKHPGIRHVYKMPARGGEMVQLTSIDGGYEMVLSPDEQTLALRHSTPDKPWELYLMKNEPGAEMKQVTRSPSQEFLSYNWRIPEFITFNASDGANVHARLYQPADSVKNNAAVIFVHGAGYLQNAHQWWSSYFREYMFHNLLADEGYTILDIDYRGSAGYGRDWRTGIYRHMGGKDLSDQVDGAAYLVNELGIAADRIGIYGGSYGGFITLMALFKHPGTFASGAALRSVTDWAHYNHGYTSNILNTPVLDSIAYYRSSPINFPQGLEDPLLICHGMVDDNVQFQDVVRLAQRLIELEKEDWEMAVYPVEPHTFKHPLSWTDEYKRIYKLFNRTLHEK